MTVLGAVAAVVIIEVGREREEGVSAVVWVSCVTSENGARWKLGVEE